MPAHLLLQQHTLMSELPLTGCAFSLSFSTRKSHVLSMPFFTEMGLAPAVTYCAAHATAIKARL